MVYLGLAPFAWALWYVVSRDVVIKRLVRPALPELPSGDREG